MTSVALPVHPKFLSRERTVAGQSFNRWLVPPAALAIHLCIGMAYGFSVFWLPLSRAVGFPRLRSARRTWAFRRPGSDRLRLKISSFGLDLHAVFLFLGSSRRCSVIGWRPRATPSGPCFRAMLVWRLLISAAGVYLHQIWMLWLGSASSAALAWAWLHFARFDAH